jgi:hypothetical protein
MIKKGAVTLAVALAVLAARPATSAAEWILNLQGAAVFTGRNDVRIPGDDGTEFSLCDELSADTAFAGRVEAGYLRKGRDYFGLVAAPLSVDSHGSVDRDVSFNGTTFPAGTKLDATFRFDSYRLTWRRKLLARGNLDAWLGLTAKVRDAAITVEGGGQRSVKDNTGFVPLINFLAEWRFAPPWSLRLAGDALAAPQGRAEDVLFALTWDLKPSAKLFAGYRILEGGADNDDVYTFSLFHYAVAGVELRF